LKVLAEEGLLKTLNISLRKHDQATCWAGPAMKPWPACWPYHNLVPPLTCTRRPGNQPGLNFTPNVAQHDVQIAAGNTFGFGSPNATVFSGSLSLIAAG
jgi:hypothetical protein